MPSKVINFTYALAHGAAQDAGNRSMKAAGRATWDVEDWDIAVDVFERLYPAKGREGAPKSTSSG